MAIDFRAATEALFDRIRVEDLAEELDCSPESIKQARMAEGTGHRTPPSGWEAAAAKLVKKKAEQFKRLADRLTANS